MQKNWFRKFRAFLLALPFLIYYRIKPRSFSAISELLSFIPFSTGKKIRYEFYKRTLAGCGDNVDFNIGTILNYADITIGDNVSFNRYNNIGKVDFGNNILVATGCNFLSGGKTHGFEDKETLIMAQKKIIQRIRIGDNVWIGTNAIIMDSIGEGCVVGAGSIVTKPVDPNSVIAGNPASVIRKRE